MVDRSYTIQAPLRRHYDTKFFDLVFHFWRPPPALCFPRTTSSPNGRRAPARPRPGSPRGHLHWFRPIPCSSRFSALTSRARSPPRIHDTWNYGAGRGLNLIPGFNSEIDVYYAPYIQHNAPKVRDGFGDVGFLYKYRFFSRNEKQGTFMLSAQLTATIPTGSYSNGSPDSAVSPTLLSGKGWGKFDVISCLGGTLPTQETNKVGRSIAWNTAAQYHLSKYVWPELESNSTWFFAGKNDGKKQNFLTPGAVFSKFKLHPSDERSRAGVAFGGGMQIATSHFHTYNHSLVFTSPLYFLDGTGGKRSQGLIVRLRPLLSSRPLSCCGKLP